MSKLNDFRLSYETSLLFVISYEYRIPFAKLLGMYNISDKIFWAYLSLFSNMSKMGVRKGSQLSKMANRIFKYTRGIKDKIYNKIYVDVVDEDGNLVYDDKGNILKDKQIKVTMTPVELDENELKIQRVLKLYATKGYSNGEVFYSNDDIKGTPPVWLHNERCTNCLACYHHCPAHAIHWGNMKRGQYLLNKLLDRK